MDVIQQIMKTEAELLVGKKCCFADCSNKAVIFDEMDNPMCDDCYEQDQNGTLNSAV
jgi:hypothetical protein